MICDGRHMFDTLIKKEKKLSTPHDLDVLHIFIFLFETLLTSLIGTSCALRNTIKMYQMHVFFRNYTYWEQNIYICCIVLLGGGGSSCESAFTTLFLVYPQCSWSSILIAEIFVFYFDIVTARVVTPPLLHPYCQPRNIQP